MTYAPACRFAIGLCTLSLLAVGCAGGSSSTGSGGASGGNSASGGNGSGGSGSGGNSASGGNGSGGSGSGGNGSGGNVGTGGNVSSGGSGGSQPTGGTSGSGGVTGSGGSASGGASGTGGATGTGGAKGGSGGGNAGATGGGGCGSFAFCDNFESDTVGGMPNSANWTIIDAAGGAGSATIDGSGANGTSKSVKVVETASRFWLRHTGTINTLGPDVHVRFYVKYMSSIQAGHGAFFATDPMALDIYNDAPQLRLGTQDMVLHWNASNDAANLPTVGPGDSSSFAPAPNTWYCLELTITPGNGHLAVSVNGSPVAGLANDGVSTANIDADWISAGSSVTSLYSTLAEFEIGWREFGSGSMTLWFDEVALSSSPIGCN